MKQQEVHYEICMEDEQGFNPRCISNDTLAEAEKELALYCRQWPAENAFIVRVTMTRVSKKKKPLNLQAV